MVRNLEIYSENAVSNGKANVDDEICAKMNKYIEEDSKILRNIICIKSLH